MRNIKTLVVASLLAAGASFAAKPAAATPSTLGFYPSTDIYGKGTFHFDADNYSKGLTNNLASSAGLTYGIGPDTDKAFGRTEAGIDYNVTDFGAKVKVGDRVTGNIKTQLYNNDASGTRVVVGAWGLGNEDAGAPNYIYLTGSKSFDFGRITLGVAHALHDQVITRDETSLQLGYDKMLTDKLQFAVDYYTGKGELSGVQPTLYYYINDKANFGLGYFRANDSNAAVRNQIYVCFDYNFDFKGK